MVPVRVNACDAGTPERDDEDTLWRNFRDNRDSPARLELLNLYDPLARQVAAGIFAKRPDNAVEFADYLQYARVGLIEALERYEYGGDASFRTYATYRIRGSVLNGVTRENDHREQMACRARMRKQRLESLQQDPSDKQTEFERLMDIAIGLALGYMLEDTGLIRADTAATLENPYTQNEYAEVCQRVAKALDALPAREASIIRYHYFHGVGFEAIAELLELSKGRVSQLHKRALTEIREQLVASGVDRRI